MKQATISIGPAHVGPVPSPGVSRRLQPRTARCICGDRITSPSHFVCPSCWSSIPGSLRDAVIKAKTRNPQAPECRAVFAFLRDRHQASHNRQPFHRSHLTH